MWRWGCNKNPVWRNLSGDEFLRPPPSLRGVGEKREPRSVTWERRRSPFGTHAGTSGPPAGPRRWAVWCRLLFLLLLLCVFVRDERVQLWCWSFAGLPKTGGGMRCTKTGGWGWGWGRVAFEEEEEEEKGGAHQNNVRLKFPLRYRYLLPGAVFAAAERRAPSSCGMNYFIIFGGKKENLAGITAHVLSLRSGREVWRQKKGKKTEGGTDGGDSGRCFVPSVLLRELFLSGASRATGLIFIYFWNNICKCLSA